MLHDNSTSLVFARKKVNSVEKSCQRCGFHYQGQSKFCGGCGVNIVSMATLVDVARPLISTADLIKEFGWKLTVEESDEVAYLSHQESKFWWVIPGLMSYDGFLILINKFRFSADVLEAEALNIVNLLNLRSWKAQASLHKDLIDDGSPVPLTMMCRLVFPLNSSLSIGDILEYLMLADKNLFHVLEHNDLLGNFVDIPYA